MRKIKKVLITGITDQDGSYLTQYKKATKILKWKPLKEFKDLVNEMVDSDLSNLK